MKPQESQVECQIYSLQTMPDEGTEVIPPPFRRRLELFFARRLSDHTKRAVLRDVNQLLDRLSQLTGRETGSSSQMSNPVPTDLDAGDLVRVRSKEEIEATLDHFGLLRGCGFMEEMESYCGTTRRVLKPVQTFLDERDYRVRRCRGVVFLEQSLCQGTRKYGRCDRSCFFFWRVEWLEKIEGLQL